MQFQRLKMAPSGQNNIIFITPHTVVTELICEGDKQKESKHQLAEIFKALDGSEYPHKWPDNACWRGTGR